MRCSFISPAVLVLAGIAASGFASATAAAQDQRYGSPLYTDGTGSTPDKNFGLPSFGMPNADLPRQRTQDPESRVPAQPDFFAKTPEYDVQKPRTSTALEMETPLFTTPEGSTTGDTTTTGSTTDDTSYSRGINR